MDLTRAQRQVVERITLGESNKQIAADLGLSEQTVKWHVSKLLRRFDLPNRAALAITYMGADLPRVKHERLLRIATRTRKRDRTGAA